MTPEDQARQQVDQQLEACGWTIQDRKEMNIYAALGVAVREFPLDVGEADYLLKIRARDMEHLGHIVHAIQAIDHVFTTETDVAFKTVFERRPLPITPTASKPDGDAGRTG